MSSNMKRNFSRYQSFHFPIKEVKNKKHKQLRCEKKNIGIRILLEDAPPLIRFRIFLEYPLSLLHQSVFTFWMAPRIWAYIPSIIKVQLRNIISIMSQKKKHYAYKKESNAKNNLENKYVFRRKIFLHEKHYDQNVFRKDKFY